MGKTVLFLGAGATKACHGPLTDEILPEIYKRAANPDSGWSLNLLKDFLEKEFHVTAASPKEQYPGLPLVMSLIDTALDRRQSFGPDWDASVVSQLREQVEFGIFDLLEERLEKSPTNNHWGMLDRLYPPGEEGPCVISTNYDLIVDTAFMFLSEYRPRPAGAPEGRLPDYRCHIRTDFYHNEPARFGTLLKLHGSLNWLYCRTCLRLELGASEARLYIKALTRLVGPNLKTLQKSFTPDGNPCPTCGTKLRPLLIAPTHFKDYRNPHLSQVWYEAERVLREATKVVFVGYSLPDDDVAVVYLLKRSLARQNPLEIVVVEYDKNNPDLPVTQHAAGRRYRTLFGDQINWNACGLDAWLAKLPQNV
jgi:hypothetical protein